MPPKLQVKPRAPPGGRRGGRGGATAAAAAATTGSAAAASTPASIEGSTTPAGESSAVSSAAAATTRSIAPPVGRLDSLKLTSGSASGTPAPSTPEGGGGSGGGDGSGGGGGGGGLRGKAPLRFKPKAVVRKTAEERAKLEATVAATSSISNPNTDPIGAPSSTATRGGFSSRDPRGGGNFRGRGRGGRGRGRGRGSADAGGYQAVTSTASGPFALGSVTSGRSKVIHERGVELRAATSKSKKSRGITIDDGEARVKSERDDPDYYSETDEESDGGPKVNVERIEDLVDSGDEEDEGDGEVVVKSAKMPAMFPLRVERYRHEEKERAIPIFKDPETTGKKGKGVLGGRKIKVEVGDFSLTWRVCVEE
ncbi:hypothetical protein L211DRAFT_51742 [Terfezia boudieri ATCC MYA-4762]|uniref:Uncharacterized protein n=1 Tax=Terfezia boudieri ATCC MYA-4762 TaxID=1051890 RepID=A0A3N4M441_9PEZI|nr:hypothetical protein L211DRAFT_51742 [Terfezia boudieri ATCC MYA-4762]